MPAFSDRWPGDSCEGVEHLYAGLSKVGGVARDYCELVAPGGRGDLAVKRRDGDTGGIPLRLELTPNVRGVGVKAQHATPHAVAERCQPRAKLCLTPARWQALDAAADLADGNGADV